MNQLALYIETLARVLILVVLVAVAIPMSIMLLVGIMADLFFSNAKAFIKRTKEFMEFSHKQSIKKK